MKKKIALIITMIMLVSAFAGCKENSKTSGVQGLTDVEYKFNEEAVKFEDSSEMPDWTGKQIELTMWYGTGSYSLKKNNIAENDVVTPEIQRITGVKLSEDSYDNNGDMQDAKLAKVIATESWPDVLWGCQNNVLNQLIEQDMLWELSDLIPEYMPNLHAMMEKGDWMKSQYDDGSVYEIDMSVPIKYAYPDMNPELLARTQVPDGGSGCVLVRDDILKMLKPEAYTQDEIENKFNTNGGFTEEEVLNASFNSKEEFYQFLRDIKALNLKVGNRDVYATYALAGSDNWDFLTVLAGALNGYNASPASIGSNYFTYFDVETGQIEYMYEQPFFKETMKELTELIREDVIAQDSLVDNRATYEEKCANGQYAILYGGTAPDVVTLNKNAKGYKYRKVAINIPFNTDKFIPIKNELSGGYKWAFMKDKISADELPQVLRYFDFMLTDVGQKLAAWGPKSAGLFEETESGRRFINKEVEASAVYGEANDGQLKYGLMNKQWPGYPHGLNKWQPIYIYDFVPNISRLNYFFSTGIHNPIETVQSIKPDVYTIAVDVPEASRFWDARTAFETAMTKVLTSTSDEEFEKLYQKMLDIAERNGLTEQTLTELNDAWRNNINKFYISNVDEYMKKH